MRFAEPFFLILLLLLPAFWWMGARLRTIEKRRRIAVLVIRTLIVLAMIFAIAQLELVKKSNSLTVYYLLDNSDSIPGSTQEQGRLLISELNKKMTTRDEAGLIVFGATPSLETPATVGYEFEGKTNSIVDTTRSDIAGAIRLAMAAFPADRMRRIVLLSDGNENQGSALETARLAKSNGIPIDVIPLRYDQWQDVSVEKVVVPQQTTKDTPFELKAYVSAERDTKGTLRVLEDGKLIAEEEVEIKAGRNSPFVLPRRVSDGGFHKYQVTLDVKGDARVQNNSGEAFTYLKSEPKVLYVEGDEEADTNYLEGALKSEQILVTRVGPAGIPRSIDELQKYDSIILSNVAAANMTRSQMQMIERGVHDLGIGLMMIGGEESFGAGGYQDTPIEEALPVSMDVKQRKMLPNGALAIVLHTCEIPAGNAWAREISTAALNVLSAEDYFGIAYYGPQPNNKAGGSAAWGSWGDYWAWEPGLAKAGDKRKMRTAIKSVEPLDMPTFGPTMDLAYKALKDVKAQVKHIVIISDGDPAPPAQETVNGIRDEGITVSTVAIAPHTGSTVETLENIAYWGAGNFYYPKTSAELPRIFTKEASIVRKSLISEGDFNPVYAQPSEILTGLTTGLPGLGGIVVTTPKELATIALVREAVQDGNVIDADPLLANWRYGLGKTVAFTSDAKNKWAAEWVTQPIYGKFWSQAVRYTLRETSNQNYQIATEIRDGVGRVVVDAVDADGTFKNYVDFTTKVINPDLTTREVRVRQVAPGRYEGTFPASNVGTYMMSLQSSEEAGASDLMTTGVSLSYSPEYDTKQSNDDFIEKLAKTSDGRIADEGYNPFTHDLTIRERPTPLWPWLLLFAALALPLDIFLRRVYLDLAEFKEWISAKFGRAEGDAAADTSRLSSLKAAKDRATTRDDEEEDKAARQSFRDRIAQQAEERPATKEPSVFEKPTATTPVRHRVKDTIGSTERGAGGEPPAGGTMGSLLEAKKRAKKKIGD